jgi:hypothetical protein
MARERRRSRVLEYFEQQETQAPETEENPDGGGGENPFHDFDSAFGLDFFDPKGGE